MPKPTCDETLIPPSSAVRVALAKSLRESRRLESLLRLAVRAEEDRDFVRALAAEGPRDPDAQGVAR